VSLFTIRNARLENLDKLYEGKNVLLEQITKTTVQMIING
jgi:aspartate kinase